MSFFYKNRSDGSARRCVSDSNSAALKYGDADVSSKRRKLPLGVENIDPTMASMTNVICEAQQQQPLVEEQKNACVEETLDYLHFKQIASETDVNSSFEINAKHTQESDFKGGLLRSTTSPLLPTSAKNDLIITTKPSQCSKGFENTFKLLESQLSTNEQKTQQVMESLSPECSLSLSSTSSKLSLENPTCLELELGAIERMKCVHIDLPNNKLEDCDLMNRPLLSLLYGFVARNTADADAKEDKADFMSGIRYHASKTVDGRNCLRIVRGILSNKVLCGNRVSQMTRAYDDIEAVTRLLEEKEKDLELTVQIGKELLTQNNTLESRISELEADLKESNDDRAQLVHELHKKSELIAVLTSDADDGNDETPTYSKSVTVDLLQRKITSLQDENKSLKMEASQLVSQTDEVEAHERQLMEDITSQLNDANSQFDGLNLELERQREENRLQHEQIVSLTARLAEAEMRLHQLTHDNDEHLSLLNITKENQNSLALELVEFKQRYQEVLALLQEAQEHLRKQRKKAMPMARSSFVTSMGLLQPDSLQSELMESSLYSENSMDSGIAGDTQRVNDRIGRLMSQQPGSGMYNSYMTASGSSTNGAGGIMPPYKRAFETVRCATKNGNYADNSDAALSQLGAMSMSSASGPRMSTMAGAASGSAQYGSSYRNSLGYETNPHLMGVKTLSCESLASQSDEGYPAQPSGVPGAPGAKDLEAALKRLSPAEVLARRAMLSYAPAGTYTYDEQPPATLPLGFRTPDSIMSTGSSGISSTTNMSGSLHQWRLPDKLQIVKPMEGSQTLHHWSRLATPTLSGLLEERPGVTIRGGRGLDDLGMQVYTLSDVEEDVNDELPGKQFEAPGCIYTYTTSIVMHPDDGLVNDLSFLSQSQMSSRMASASTSRQPSCPPTPRAGLSRKNSCSTFSVNLGLASMLNERGIKAVTPSALNTPAGPNFSPTVTPCNSPEGSPTRSRSPEPLFGLLSSGADLIYKKLIGGDMERPNRQQQKQQKIMLSRLERRALRSLKLVEKVESIGLENIIATQPLMSGIANRSSSPLAQMQMGGSMKQLQHAQHGIVNTNVDIHFDRDQIKGVLHKGLNAPGRAMSSASSNSSMYGSDSDELMFCEIQKRSAAVSDVETTSMAAASLSDSCATFTYSVGISESAAAQSTTSTGITTSAASDTRVRQMQRQKSRRNVKNGIAAQRPDLGTIGGGRVRSDLGKVSPPLKHEPRHRHSGAGASGGAGAVGGGSETIEATAAPSEPQTFTQAFVGSVSSLLFGRKGGWL